MFNEANRAAGAKNVVQESGLCFELVVVTTQIRESGRTYRVIVSALILLSKPSRFRPDPYAPERLKCKNRNFDTLNGPSATPPLAALSLEPQ